MLRQIVAEQPSVVGIMIASVCARLLGAFVVASAAAPITVKAQPAGRPAVSIPVTMRIAEIVDQTRDGFLAVRCKFRSMDWYNRVADRATDEAMNLARSRAKELTGELYEGSAVQYVHGALQQGLHSAEKEFSRDSVAMCGALVRSNVINNLDSYSGFQAGGKRAP